MNRTALTRRCASGLLLLATASLVAACGDPVVVLGDSPGFMRVVAGIPDSIGTRFDPLATRTRFTDPTGVAFDDPKGILYIADRGSNFTSAGVTRRVTRIMAVTSSGQNTLLLDSGGCPVGPCIVEATQMAFAPDGTLLIADAIGHRILRFNPTSRTVTVVAGTGVDAFSADGSAAVQSPISRPAGVAVDAAGAVYFSETGAHRVRRVDAGGALRTVAGTGVASHSGDNGAALAAAVNQPTGLAISRGRLFVSETGAHAVRMVDLAAGTITTVAGSLAAGFAGDGGPATQGRLASPLGLTVSADGNTLYIADRDNHRVRSVSLLSGVINTFSGTGSTVFAGRRLPAGEAALRQPHGVWASDRGFLFVADTGHQIVWRATLTL